MRTIILTAAILAVAACNKGGDTATPADAAAPADATDAPVADAAPAEATEPDHDKLVLHIREHLELPADRAKILEACANTPEFSEGEKQWVADNLPEGDYQSAEDVIAAMGLATE